jgi:hypothetical protein
MDHAQSDTDSLHNEMRNIIEEARVILPGLQALFGFQTIAVFNDRFASLPIHATVCHLTGLGMVIVAIALVMTPAVYYRVVGPRCVSPRMVSRSSWLIRAAMAPLALGLALDMFTVIYAVTGALAASMVGALATLLILSSLWFVFPWYERRQLRQNQV